MPATNTYTDEYGVWPFLGLIAVMLFVIGFNRGIARFMLRKLIGPLPGQPGYERLKAMKGSGTTEAVARVVVVVWASIVIAMCVLALVGGLGDD